MDARHYRITALLLGLAVAVLLAIGTAPADAIEPQAAASGACVHPPPHKDDSIHFQG